MQATRALRAARGLKANITGFTPEGLRAATGKPQYDPWARREEWRFEAHQSRWNRFRPALPGLGIGTAAFAVYCAYEYMFLGDSHHGHGDAHGHGHGEKH